MAPVTLNLAVHSGDETVVWRRLWHTDFLPGEGDRVSLWDHLAPYRPGFEHGPLWPVKSRRWLSDGTVIVELADMQVDSEQRPGATPWWTHEGGDPEAILAQERWSRGDWT